MGSKIGCVDTSKGLANPTVICNIFQVLNHSGQKIDMIGAGGTTIFPDNYFFIDCSYILVCLRYGVIALLLLLIVYSLSCIKNKKDIYFLYAITLVSINCVIAHHILELEYNPFALAILSQCVHPPVADNFSYSKQHV